MENPDFWHAKWKADKIGFHKTTYHSALMKYWPGLNLAENTTVFVPLCGKSSDMVWLEKQGHHVIGVELSPIAAKDFFAENDIPCAVSPAGKFQKYHGGNITILVGDFFDLTETDIPHISSVYDRAALIALPLEMRQKYIRHLKSILPKNNSQILLITLCYDQSQMNGPPFSVTEKDLDTYFSAWCRIERLATTAPENFRGISAREQVFHISEKP